MDMSERCKRDKDYTVQITITEVIKGKCEQGFKPGDTWLIEKNLTPGSFCMNAFCQAVYPALRTFRYGGEQRWDKDKNVTYVACPDLHHHVIFELRRLPLA